MSNEKDRFTDKITDTQLLADSVKHQISTFGVESLTVNELTPEDLENISWSGSQLHIEHVREELERVDDGEVDYLVVRAPNGTPICKAIVDYTQYEDAGTIGQFATMPELRSLGIGSLLIQKAEEKILERGYHTARLGVESDNTGAQELYHRQGYVVDGREQQSWQETNDQGQPYEHVADVILMKKDLDAELDQSSLSERIKQLYTLFDQYKNLIGPLINSGRASELKEDMAHIDRYPVVVYDDFFTDHVGELFAALRDGLDKSLEGDIDRQTLDTMNRDEPVVQLMYFLEDLLSMVNAANAVPVGVQELIVYMDAEDGSGAVYNNIGEHVDNQGSILCNFDVVGEISYKFKPFLNENALHDPPDLGEEGLYQGSYHDITEKVRIKSNQLVILPAGVKIIERGDESHMSIPHAVTHDGQGVTRNLVMIA